MNKWTRPALAFFAVFFLLFAACGHGDDDDNDDSSPGDDDDNATLEVEFTPDAPGEAGAIWLELGQVLAEENTFTLKVIGDGLTAYGVAGRLLFDPQVVTLTAVQAGEALAGDNAVIVAAGAANELGGVFGFSRSVNYQQSAALVKTKIIGEVTFTIQDKGETTISFNVDRSRVLDHSLDSVEVGHWYGGKLAIK